MSQTTQNNPIQASPLHPQPSLAPGDDAHGAEVVLSNAEPGARDSLPRDLRPTSDFPADPSALSRETLEAHYRAMRHSHVFLARSRGQQKRYAKHFSRQRNQLFNTLHVYQEKIAVLGREKVEVMQLAKSFQRDLEVFEQKDQALNQLLDELENAKENTGFWSVFTITRLLEQMRKLLRGGGPG